jgi:hypothetical protein
MTKKENEERIKVLSNYKGRTIILKNSTSIEKEFELKEIFSISFSEIRSAGSSSEDPDIYSSSLFGLLVSENETIENIGIDIIINAIDNNLIIEY